jgi:hypothetical protein
VLQSGRLTNIRLAGKNARDMHERFYFTSLSMTSCANDIKLFIHD